MVRALLIRGMFVGLLAGVLAFAFAYHFGEPQVQRAIDFEASLAKPDGEPEGITRDAQRTFGLLTGSVVTGIALGGIFALTFAYAYGRLGRLGARATAAMLALGAYVTVILVPFTKYPVNPPGVGNPATIDRRTILYMLMIAISVLSAVAAVRIRRRLLAGHGAWNAAIIATAVFVALIAAAEVVLPAVQETPKTFPADVLYEFRVASLGSTATLWLTIGLAFGAAAERLLARARPAAGVPGGAAA